MALRLLGAKLSERMFLRHLVKGLSSLQQSANTTVPLAQSGSVLIRRGRNFSSGHSPIENVPKINSCKKMSGVPGTKNPTVPERQCKCDPDCSRRKIEEFVYRIQVFILWSMCLAAAFNLYSIVQLNRAHKTLDDLKEIFSRYK